MAFAYPITTENNELPGVYNEATFDPAHPELSRVGDKPAVTNEIDSTDSQEGTYRENHDVFVDSGNLPTEGNTKNDLMLPARSNSVNGVILPQYSYTFDNKTKNYAKYIPVILHLLIH